MTTDWEYMVGFMMFAILVAVISAIVVGAIVLF
jgi:hypothetical protein